MRHQPFKPYKAPNLPGGFCELHAATAVLRPGCRLHWEPFETLPLGGGLALTSTAVWVRMHARIEAYACTWYIEDIPYIHTHMCKHITLILCLYTYVCIYICTHVSVHTCIHTHIHTYVFMYVCMHVYCTRIHKYACVCAHLCSCAPCLCSNCLGTLLLFHSVRLSIYLSVCLCQQSFL